MVLGAPSRREVPARIPCGWEQRLRVVESPRVSTLGAVADMPRRGPLACGATAVAKTMVVSCLSSFLLASSLIYPGLLGDTRDIPCQVQYAQLRKKYFLLISLPTVSDCFGAVPTVPTVSTHFPTRIDVFMYCPALRSPSASLGLTDGATRIRPTSFVPVKMTEDFVSSGSHCRTLEWSEQ